MAAHHYSLHYCEQCGAPFTGGNRARWCEVHREERRRIKHQAWARAKAEDRSRVMETGLNGPEGVAVAMIKRAALDAKGIGVNGNPVSDKVMDEAREWMKVVGRDWAPLFRIRADAVEKALEEW